MTIMAMATIIAHDKQKTRGNDQVVAGNVGLQLFINFAIHPLQETISAIRENHNQVKQRRTVHATIYH